MLRKILVLTLLGTMLVTTSAFAALDKGKITREIQPYL